MAGGIDPGWQPNIPRTGGLVPVPTGAVWLDAVPGITGFWLEVGGDSEAQMQATARRLLPIVAALLEMERQRALLSEELASRYKEIELLYAISEILGRTVDLAEAAETIVRDVSTVVGARRVSILVYDPPSGKLRTVAARGFRADSVALLDVTDPGSVAAQVFRERQPLVCDSADSPPRRLAAGRGYRSHAYLSVPISYAAPGGVGRCVGVINLTERIGGDSFTTDDQKLVSAIATQIGAAIENARLVARDRQQERLRRELELAHDLQLKLLPSPAVLQGDAEVAARCVPAESVGGDFYTFSRHGRGRVGVTLGDVASHGFSAALIMALVMSAAAIHAAASVTPDETLNALLDSLSHELATTDMYLTIFHGVLDPLAGRLSYASAGHSHAFRVPRFGDPERLEATAPPLGLAAAGSVRRRQVPWSVTTDLLCLWTDGLVDARNAHGEPFGERRLLDRICARQAESPETIVREVLLEADAFAPMPTDDRTLLVLRI